MLSTSKFNYRKAANILTLIRIFLGLPILLFLIQGKLIFAWLLLIIGGFTDWLDGLLARKSGGGTSWGAQMDPLADKLMLLAPILWMVKVNILPLWAIWILISRELLITSWRTTKKKGVPASKVAKVKTTLQFSSIILLLIPNYLVSNTIYILTIELGYILFWSSLIMAIISAYKYINSQST